MRKYATFVLCGLALVACQQKEGPASGRGKTTTSVIPSDVRNAKVNEVITPAPQFIDHALLGSQVGKDGAVAQDSPSVAAGQPVYLTMFFRESPPGLQASAVWMTADKKTLRTERKDMNGSKMATFSMENLKPGIYKVVGYWGGNIATEREFQITGAAKGKRKKG